MFHAEHPPPLCEEILVDVFCKLCEQSFFSLGTYGRSTSSPS